MKTNYRDLILRTFQKKKIDRVVWQPRLMLWYNGNSISQIKEPDQSDNPLKIKFGDRNKNVPKEWFGKNIMELHELLDASIRYTAETIGLNYFYHQKKDGYKIERKNVTDSDGTTRMKITTPVGTVYERSSHGYKVEKMVKKPEDLKVAKYLVESQETVYNPIMYEAALEELDDLGVPQCYFFRSPYQRCVLEFLGFEKTTIWLRRKPELMEDFMNFLNDWDKKNYKAIINSDLQILNFGENIDSNLSPPRQFEKYLLPYYEERVKWIKNAPIPKFSHIHIDGHFHDLLPLLADLPFDGIEALTPEPQGDVTLREMKNAIGEKIVLDVIPATLFMHEFPEKRLKETVTEILENFAPNLILGISDELPGNTDGRRLKIVGELAEKYEI